jgi:hypothetical protein
MAWRVARNARVVPRGTVYGCNGLTQICPARNCPAAVAELSRLPWRLCHASCPACVSDRAPRFASDNRSSPGLSGRRHRLGLGFLGYHFGDRHQIGTEVKQLRGPGVTGEILRDRAQDHSIDMRSDPQKKSQPAIPDIGVVVAIDVAQQQARLRAVQDDPDVIVDASCPEVLVLGSIDAMEMQSGRGRIGLNVEDGDLRRLLVRGRKAVQAGGEGVRDAEFPCKAVLQNHASVSGSLVPSMYTPPCTSSIDQSGCPFSTSWNSALFIATLLNSPPGSSCPPPRPAPPPPPATPDPPAPPRAMRSVRRSRL